MAGKFLTKEISFGNVSLTHRALFARHLAVMLRSGLPITEALDIAATSSEGALKSILRKVLKSVETGRTLSAAFSDYPRVFSGLFVEAIRAGESSGTLVENLEHVALELEKERDLLRKVRGAMVYPAFILAATLVMGVTVSFFILPKITPLFEGLHVKLPLTTRMLISFSHFIETSGLYFLLGLVLFIFFTLWLVRQKFVKPITHWLLLRIPLIGPITHGAHMARFSRTLGTLLKSGIRIGEALRITQSTMGNIYYEGALGTIERRVGTGTKLSESLEEFSLLFPVIVRRMIKVGEESGRLEETLLFLSDYYDSEVDGATKTLSTALEPMLLLFIGLVVAGFALSIITPIYEITGNIKR
jgi:type IV pilus assembly protein PilC